MIYHIFYMIYLFDIMILHIYIIITFYIILVSVVDCGLSASWLKSQHWPSGRFGTVALITSPWLNLQEWSFSEVSCRKCLFQELWTLTVAFQDKTSEGDYATGSAAKPWMSEPTCRMWISTSRNPDLNSTYRCLPNSRTGKQQAVKEAGKEGSNLASKQCKRSKPAK